MTRAVHSRWLDSTAVNEFKNLLLRFISKVIVASEDRSDYVIKEGLLYSTAEFC